MTVSETCADCGEPVSRYPSGVIVHRTTAMKSCSAPGPGILRKGQVVKYRRSPRKGSRIEYMRLLEDAPERIRDTGTYVTLYGYRTRADGQPTQVRPVTRVLFAAEVIRVEFPESDPVARLRVGAPCPNGCTERGTDGRMVPLLLQESCPGSGDGEITCMSCWDAWQEEPQ